MKFLLKLSVLFFVFLSIAACDNKDSKHDDFLPRDYYNKEKGCIDKGTSEEYDIIPQVNFIRKNTDLSTPLQLGVEFHVFNYGEDIIFMPTYRENIYFGSFAPNCTFKEVSVDKVRNYSKSISETYGEYGVIPFFYIDSYNSTNLIISPMALKFLQDPNDKDCLVYVRAEFPAYNVYQDYIFKGDYLTKYILREYYNKVSTCSTVYISVSDVTSKFKEIR